KDFLVQRYIRLNHNAVAVEKQEAVKALSFDFKRDLRKEIGNIILNKEQFIDFEIFNSRINSIIKIDFLFISKDYLYARDCFANFYFQYLFEDKSDIYNKKIVRG
ncbi:hypothetical protein D0809_29620, partial [Flavobacterium circumlabens]